MKVKNLKQVIFEKINSEDMPVERMQLQIEGGEILHKNMKALDEYDIKNDSNIILEIVDKVNTPTSRERKPRAPKDEPKVAINFNVKGQELSSKVEVPKNTKVKQLKKIILGELGMEEIGDLKIYINDNEYDNEKGSVKDMDLEGANYTIDVEVVFKISIEVQGKGKQYSDTVCVQPHEKLEVLRSKVHFFKLFLQRRHQLVEKQSNRVFDDLSMTFRDAGLKDGS